MKVVGKQSPLADVDAASSDKSSMFGSCQSIRVSIHSSACCFLLVSTGVDYMVNHIGLLGDRGSWGINSCSFPNSVLLCTTEFVNIYYLCWGTRQNLGQLRFQPAQTTEYSKSR